MDRWRSPGAFPGRAAEPGDRRRRRYPERYRSAEQARAGLRASARRVAADRPGTCPPPARRSPPATPRGTDRPVRDWPARARPRRAPHAPPKGAKHRVPRVATYRRPLRKLLLANLDQRVDHVPREPIRAKALVRRRGQKNVCRVDIAFAVSLGDPAQESLELGE